MYLIKTPWWIKRWVYPGYRWSLDRGQKKIYLSFDDGPHPDATVFALDTLKQYHATATFFCIGKNVLEFPGIYKRILEERHAVGNHTQDHLNGWKTADEVYLSNIGEAAKYIDSNLFRPPYGKITRFQAKQLQEKQGYRIVMWSVLSGDFDTGLAPAACWKNVLKATGDGSIVVFHDSAKAMERMAYALPRVLEYYSEKGYRFEKIPANA
jgi:peptidoglycan-N-acetylglucosamine deacetylase